MQYNTSFHIYKLTTKLRTKKGNSSKITFSEIISFISLEQISSDEVGQIIIFVGD